MELAALSSADYEYLDGGDDGRLERFGPYVFSRPSPAALWRRERPELWEQADGVYTRGSAGNGSWAFRQKLPATWCVQIDNLAFHVKPTGFGHMGFFPEHTSHWAWVAEQIRAVSAPPCRVLHLFAYTGAMTLLAARSGAEVCHVDAVPDINDWARRNAETSGLAQAPIRWITDDALKFAAREGRRERRYDAIILDPPSYGKGPRGEKWILEEHMATLLDHLLPLMSDRPRFVLFTCHTLGFSPVLMSNLLMPWQDRFGGRIDAGTMVIGNPSCRRLLPSGFFARWAAGA